MHRVATTTRSPRWQEFLRKRRINELNRQLADQEQQQQLDKFLAQADGATPLPMMIPSSRRNIIFTGIAAACGIPLAIIYGSGTLPS